MLIHFGVDTLQAGWTNSTVCVGTFDGVHLGHQQLIRETVRQARAAEHPSVVVTFDRHPAATLAPGRCPPAVATLSENLAQMEKLGVAVAVILTFDERLAHTPAERFFDDILVKRLHAAAVVVGHDFGFGFEREGDGNWLKERIETTILPPVQIGDHRVSSSEVRGRVATGDMPGAARLLGRDWAFRGVVTQGQKLGRTLGYPTINLAGSTATVMPPDGVYAGSVDCTAGTFAAAISLGMRPTVDGRDRKLEAYLLDYPGADLYGEAVRLAFTIRLRDEVRFESLEALVAQMERDVAEVRRISQSAVASQP